MDPRPKFQDSKETLWQKTLSLINKIDDDSGRSVGIEEGIKETIVALNINGINTVASCEGHADLLGHGDCHYPWVLIEEDLDKILDIHKLIENYLKEFYSKRQTSEDFRLKASKPFHNQFTLTSVEDDDFTEEENQALVKKLPQLQQEMRDFTEFLKAKFFVT